MLATAVGLALKRDTSGTDDLFPSLQLLIKKGICFRRRDGVSHSQAGAISPSTPPRATTTHIHADRRPSGPTAGYFSREADVTKEPVY
jgi:hypothetical protein